MTRTPANGRKWDFAQTHASGRWLGSLPQGSPKGDMSGSEGGNAQRRGGGLKEGGRPAHCCWEDLFDGRREVFLGFGAREWEK
jgi:hypothetical protein